MLDNLLFEKKSYFLPNADSAVRAQCNKSRRVSLVGGNIVGNSRSEASGVCARIRRGGYYGFSSIADYSVKSVEAVVRAANENAVFMESRALSGKRPLPLSTSGEVIDYTDMPDAEQRFYIDFCKDLDNYISKKYPDLATRRIFATSENIEKLIITTDCADGHTGMIRSYVYIMMSLNTASGVPVETTEIYGGWGIFEKYFHTPQDFFEKIDRQYAKTAEKRDGIYPEAGVKCCILAGELSGMLAHEAVGHTVEADLVAAGSVAAYTLNKAVASELVSMTDYAHTAFGKPVPLPITIDDEGVIAKDAPLIKDGILVGYMNNRESACKYGTEPCGNARASAFSDEPLIRMRNTAVLPGRSKLEDMIASIDDGYIFLETNNGQADSTGEFMFGVTMGYEIKNGKKGRALLDTTISGVAFDLLKTVDMVSDSVYWASSGYCGKKQSIPVGLGGPAVRCRINVGGR